jgi:hypothetical protein
MTTWSMHVFSAATLTSLVLPLPCVAQETMTRYIEPNEHAYSFEYPIGWTVKGGIQRRSALQPHSLSLLTSPGGGTVMLFGNPEKIVYSIPTAVGYRLGHQEGSLESDASGEPMLVRRYLTGAQFATMIGGGLLQRLGCENVQVTGTQQMPWPADNVHTKTAGEVFFACDKNGRQFDGYMFSVTALIGQPNGIGQWNADTSLFFVTPHGNAANAGALAASIVASVQLNQQWTAQQMRVAGDYAQHAAQLMEQQLSNEANLIRQNFADNQLAQAQTADEWHRLMSGFDEYEDPNGNRHTVPYGPDNWWINSRGQTTPTPGPLSPGSDWRGMKRVPLGQED